MPKIPRVLVIEPDAPTAVGWATELSQHGCRVAVVPNWAAAQPLAQRGCDVAILELELGDAVGTDAWLAIQALNPQAVGIMVTHSPALHTLVNVHEPGIVAYLLKPFSPQTMGELVLAQLAWHNDPRRPTPLNPLADPDWRAITTQTLNRALAVRPTSRPTARRPRAHLPIRLPFAIAVALVLLLCVLGAGTIGITTAAAQRALPGQTLYPVKITFEKVEVNLTPGETAKSRLYLGFARKRLDEIRTLIHEQQYTYIPDAIVAYEDQINGVTAELNQISESNVSEVVTLAPELSATLESYSTDLNTLRLTGPHQVRTILDHAITVSRASKSVVDSHWSVALTLQTPTPALNPTATFTAHPSSTYTTTLTPFPSATFTATSTRIATSTLVPPSPSATLFGTDTPVSAPTLTVTPLPVDTSTAIATATEIPISPTLTITFTPTPSATATITPTETSVPTDTPTDTPTATPTDTPTDTPTPTPTDTPTPTPTDTPVPTNTPTDTPTPTPTDTPVPTNTPTDTPAATFAPAGNPTGVPPSSPSITPASASGPSGTDTPLPTGPPTAAPTDTPPPTRTPPATDTASPPARTQTPAPTLTGQP